MANCQALLTICTQTSWSSLVPMALSWRSEKRRPPGIATTRTGHSILIFALQTHFGRYCPPAIPTSLVRASRIKRRLGYAAFSNPQTGSVASAIQLHLTVPPGVAKAPGPPRAATQTFAYYDAMNDGRHAGPPNQQNCTLPAHFRQRGQIRRHLRRLVQ